MGLHGQDGLSRIINGLEAVTVIQNQFSSVAGAYGHILRDLQECGYKSSLCVNGTFPIPDIHVNA